MEISHLPLKQGIMGDIISLGGGGGGVQGGHVAPSRERLNMNMEGETCSAFKIPLTLCACFSL